jgi:SAM-dependent methyltransferase
MTTAGRPDNPFAASEVGRLYQRGRPYHHLRTLARALALLEVTEVDCALDLACGTGMSATALRERARFVIAADRSPEMLAVAPRTAGIAYVRSEAERLPFPDATFAGITVSSGVHWFDQDRFFAEAKRILRDGGWIALYDHYFIGEMVDVPEFTTWASLALKRYPLPPRTLQVGDPRADVPMGFAKVGDEFYGDDIEMTQTEFVDYQLTLSTCVVPVENGTPREEIRQWLTTSTADLFAGAPTRTVRFLGSVTCLRPSART